MADTAAADVIQYITTADQQSTEQAVQTTLNSALASVLTDNHSDAKLTVTPLLYQNGSYTFHRTTVSPQAAKPGRPICNAVAIGQEADGPTAILGRVQYPGRSRGKWAPRRERMWSHDERRVRHGMRRLTPCFSCPTTGCTTCPTTSCYQLQPQACFSIGSYLASYNSQQTAVINDIFDQLGDLPVNLRAVGYQGLANTYVTLNQLISASGTVLSPSNVMTGSLTREDLVTLFSDAVQNQQQSGMCSSGTSSRNQCRAGAVCTGGGTEHRPAFLPALQPRLRRWIDLYQRSDDSPDVRAAVNRHQRSAGPDHGGRVFQWLQRHLRRPRRVLGPPALRLRLGLGGRPTRPDRLRSARLGRPHGRLATRSGTPTCATTAQVAGTLTVAVGAYSGIAIPFTAATGTATFNFAACTSNHVTTTMDAMTTTASSAATIGGASLVTLTFPGDSTSSMSFLNGGPPGVVPPTASTASAGSNPKQMTGTANPIPTVSGASGLWSRQSVPCLHRSIPSWARSCRRRALLSPGPALPTSASIATRSSPVHERRDSAHRWRPQLARSSSPR